MNPHGGRRKSFNPITKELKSCSTRKIKLLNLKQDFLNAKKVKLNNYYMIPNGYKWGNCDDWRWIF